MAAGNLTISSTADLDSLVTALQSAADSIQTQSSNISTLQGTLDSVLGGSAVSSFETKFALWVTNLSTVATEMEAAAGDLAALSAAVDAQTSNLNSIA